MKFHYLEWVFETLNKRVAQGIKLNELFIVLPFPEEGEIDWNCFEVFRDFGKSQGNDLQRDYPELYKIYKNSISNKEMTLKVFFISPERQAKPLILWKRKYNYPKTNQLIKTPAFHDITQLTRVN